jgi:predicted translin family RNA/ssDNA-binding protein
MSWYYFVILNLYYLYSMSLDTKYLQSLQTHISTSAKTRQAVIAASNEVIFLSKRVIFALHRRDTVEATQKLTTAKEKLAAIAKQFKAYPFVDEGAYRAAAEEYVEASIFFSFCTKKTLGKVAGVTDEEIYMAGLLDVPGELYRYALHAATNRDMKEVDRAAAVAQELYGVLIGFEFTQYLRTKFDQAKQAIHKLEQVVYEVSLRG